MKAVRAACLRACWPAWLVLGAATSQAQSSGSLPDVEIKASAPGSAAANQAHHVTVITAADIARSTAQSVSELLQVEANLGLQNYFGRDQGATVDMRGMGATASSNVLVVVDGVRFNENDLSGADLSSLALSQIERIEVVRGGGAVRHGSGAVGGVIEITTVRARNEPFQASMQGLLGAYQTHEQQWQASGSLGGLLVSAQLKDARSEGYRQNSAMRSRASALELAGQPTQLGPLDQWFIKATNVEGEHQFPGPVSLAAMAGTSSQRRASTSLGDQGQMHDQRWVAGAGLNGDALGRLDARISARDRSNPFVMGRNPAASLQDQQTVIASQSHDLQLTYTGRWGGWPVSMGWQQSKADYGRLGPGQAVADSTRSLQGQTSQRAWWADTNWALSPQWSLSGGLRLDRWTQQGQFKAYTRECGQVEWFEFEGVSHPKQAECVDAFRSRGPASAQDANSWFNRGSELALVWRPEPGWKLHAQASQHFRNPNVDELFKASTDLRPQHGRTGELGISRSMGAAWAWSATAFDIRTEHEIGYSLDPVSSEQVNRNQTQPTRRQGLELDGRWQALPAWRLQAQAGWVRPRFEGTGQVIPLVARFQASVQSQVRTSAQSWWSVSLRHVGARDDGNQSPATPFERLPAYQVLDTAWRLQWRQCQITLGVNNVLDRAYSTLAFSNTYYPMPERHAYVALKWQLN
jgi:iron complex outermembrane receptor protein